MAKLEVSGKIKMKNIKELEDLVLKLNETIERIKNFEGIWTVEEDKNEKTLDIRKKDGDILKIGNLSLGYKTFVGKEVKEDDLEICQWDLKENYKWTIASFDCKYEDGIRFYELNSCANRLNNKEIEWENFGKLVQKGYEILKDLEDKKC